MMPTFCHSVQVSGYKSEKSVLALSTTSTTARASSSAPVPPLAQWLAVMIFTDR